MCDSARDNPLEVRQAVEELTRSQIYYRAV
jgi:hypothetical protein